MKRSMAMGIVCAALLASGAAHADNHGYSDKTGSFGIGADSSLGGSVGLVGGVDAAMSGRFALSDSLGLQGLLGVRRDSQSETDSSATSILIGARGIFDVLAAMFAADPNVSVGLVGGLVIVRDSISQGDMDDSPMTIIIEGGIRPEWFVTDHLSVHTQIGLAFAFVGESDSGITQAGTVINFLGNGDVVGSAGFTFWWK